jgi:tetratricopeptide (TPR) repeat protein
MEMLLGKRTWLWGTKAAEVLEGAVREAEQGPAVFRVDPSRELVEVLRRCFRRNPAERWRSMREAADAVTAIYAKEVGRPYPRVFPPLTVRAPAAVYSRRTKRGAAWSDPAVWVKKAQEAQPENLQAADWLMEPGPGSYRARAIDDLVAYEQAYDFFSRLVGGGRTDLEPELARLCYNKALVHETAGDIAGTLVLLDRAIELFERLAKAGTERAFAEALANCCSAKAWTQSSLGNLPGAVELFDRAIRLHAQASTEKSATRCQGVVADCCSGKALALVRQENYDGAADLLDRTIAILDHQVNQEQCAERIDDLANAYRDKALALALRGSGSAWERFFSPKKWVDGALSLFDQAIGLYNRPGSEESIRRRSVERAKCFVNKGNLLFRSGQWHAALQDYDYALSFLQTLEPGRVQRELAVCLMNKAVALGEVEGEAAAAEPYERASELFENLVRKGGRRELAHHLAVCWMNRGCAVAAAGDDATGAMLIDRAEKFFEQDLKAATTATAREDLALCWMNLAVTVGRRGRTSAANELYDRSLKALTALWRDGHRRAMDHFGLCWMNLGTLQWRAGERREAFKSYRRAVTALGYSASSRRPDLAADLAVCRLNEALAHYELRNRWWAAWRAGQAGRIVASLPPIDGHPAVGDPALRMLAGFVAKHEGRPSLGQFRQFLETQRLLAVKGTLNRMRKRVLDLM